MVELDVKLAEIYKNQLSQPLKINIRNDIVCSLFTSDSLANAVSDSEIVFGDNFEINRRRKMQLAKLINEKLLLYPLTEENLNCADEIRAIIVNNSLFGNFSDYSNLTFSQERLGEAFDVFAKNKKPMTEIKNQCYKDLFVLRILWFNNRLHQLITEFPLPSDTTERKNILIQKAQLREYINRNAKDLIENVVNNINPKWICDIETIDWAINGERQMLTAFAHKQYLQAQKDIARNGYNKSINAYINGLELTKENVVTFFDVMKICYSKALELQNNENQQINERN